MRFYGLFEVANQKVRKAIDVKRFASIHFEFTLSLFPSFNMFKPELDILGVLLLHKKQIDVGFLFVVPLIGDKFRHNIAQTNEATDVKLLM